jgi:hypothetical protein
MPQSAIDVLVGRQVLQITVAASLQEGSAFLLRLNSGTLLRSIVIFPVAEFS